MSRLTKKFYRHMKKLLGAQRSRKINISARRAIHRMRVRPSVKPKHVVHVAGAGIYIAGNIIDIKGNLSGMDVLLSDGRYLDLMDSIIRIPSDTVFGVSARGLDGTPASFATFIEYPAQTSEDCVPVKLRIHDKKGKTWEKKLNSSDSRVQPLFHIQKILAKSPVESESKRALFDSLYGPAIQEIWRSRVAQRPKVEELRFNEHLAPSQPDVSLIVPIYSRYDFIEYQLSSFVRDPDMLKHEIIYVIDDPRLQDEIRSSCDSLSRIYPISFRVLLLERNMGYAGANNIGVEHSQGPNILLLNSDVMPASSGWLRVLLNTVGDSLEHSVTGVRLLYEDRTVQHDGMQFFASPFMNNLWTNVHPGKGMPTDIVDHEAELVSREAVTGACLLMTKKNYQAIDGLNEQYILGDFEDSDLCLMAQKHGLKIQLAPKVELYHLERLSQSLVAADRWKQEVTYFNCWQHHGKWNTDILNLKGKYSMGLVHG